MTQPSWESGMSMAFALTMRNLNGFPRGKQGNLLAEFSH